MPCFVVICFTVSFFHEDDFFHPQVVIWVVCDLSQLCWVPVRIAISTKNPHGLILWNNKFLPCVKTPANISLKTHLCDVDASLLILLTINCIHILHTELELTCIQGFSGGIFSHANIVQCRQYQSIWSIRLSKIQLTRTSTSKTPRGTLLYKLYTVFTRV